MINVKELLGEIKEHLLKDEKPSLYLEKLFGNEELKEIHPFSILYSERYIEQSPVHHPEGDVWKHTLMVVDNAAKLRNYSSNKEVFMWAALLHDIGKVKTTKVRKGKITAYDHDKVGSEMVYEFFREGDFNSDTVEKISKLVRWHMQVLFVVKNLPFADIKTMLKEVDSKDVVLLNLSDRLGRGALSIEKLEEEKNNISIFSEKIGVDKNTVEEILNNIKV